MGFTGLADEDPCWRPELMARVLIGTDEVVGVASTHGTAVLPFQTKADHTICVISIISLAVLTRYVVAEAPAGMVSTSTDGIEARSLRLAVTVALHVESV